MLHKDKTYIIGIIGPNTQIHSLLQKMASDVPIPECDRWTHCAIQFHDGDNWQVIEANMDFGVQKLPVYRWLAMDEGCRHLEIHEAVVDTFEAMTHIGLPFYGLHEWFPALMRGDLVPFEGPGVHCGELIAKCLWGFPREPRITHPAHIQAWLYEKNGVLWEADNERTTRR